MTKKVVGVYDNQTELIDAIEEYKNNGSSIQDFSIIGDTSEFSSALESRTGITTENLDSNDSTENRDGGFWQSLMTAFNADNNLGGNSPDLSDRLVGLGLTEDAAREYEEDVRNGRMILLADTNASSVTDTGYSAVQTEYVTDSSVTGTGVRNYDADNRNYETENNDTNEQTLKLREEQLDVSKETVQSGEVEVHKEVVEDRKTVNIPVTREEVYVERRDVNEATTGVDSTIDDEETIRVPIMEEKVEVTKKPVVKEELVVGKRKVTDTEQVVENVKHEEAHVERDDERSVMGTDLDRGFKDR